MLAERQRVDLRGLREPLEFLGRVGRRPVSPERIRNPTRPQVRRAPLKPREHLLGLRQRGRVVAHQSQTRREQLRRRRDVQRWPVRHDLRADLEERRVPLARPRERLATGDRADRARERLRARGLGSPYTLREGLQATPARVGASGGVLGGRVAPRGGLEEQGVHVERLAVLPDVLGRVGRPLGVARAEVPPSEVLARGVRRALGVAFVQDVPEPRPLARQHRAAEREHQAAL